MRDDRHPDELGVREPRTFSIDAATTGGSRITAAIRLYGVYGCNRGGRRLK